MSRVFLSLGSNRGPSAAVLDGAVACLAESLGGLRISSLWKSKARYYLDQPPFLNLVVQAETDLEPAALLETTAAIEARFGRDRGREIPKGPRDLDIDILLIGELRVSTETLVIPHPGMTERKFVLLPLVELERDLVHPVTGIPFLRYLSGLAPQGIYLLGPPGYAARNP